MTKLKVGRMERGLVLDLAIDKSNLNNHQVESITNYCSINPQQLYTSPHHIAIIDSKSFIIKPNMRHGSSLNPSKIQSTSLK